MLVYFYQTKRNHELPKTNFSNLFQASLEYFQMDRKSITFFYFINGTGSVDHSGNRSKAIITRFIEIRF